MGTTPGLRRRARAPQPVHVLALASLLAVAVMVVACGPSTGSASPTAGASAPAGSGSVGPKPTYWPTGTVEAAIALGAADGDFTKMANDVVAAVDSNDAVRVLQAMSDALAFLQGNEKNIPHLQNYPATKEVGDKVAAAYAQMIEGAQTAIAGMNAGDSTKVQAGFTEFFAGNAAYVATSPALGDLAGQAVFMKRQLLR